MLTVEKLENKLKALKIKGQFITLKDNDFYIDYIIKFDDNVKLKTIRNNIEDIGVVIGKKIIDVVVEGDYIALRTAKSNRPAVDFWSFQKDIINNTTGHELPLAIGLNENGNQVFLDLAKMPHLLVGGSTRSGKSVFLNNCIMSLISNQKTNLVLIDCKKVEFTLYDGLKPLLCPVVDNPKKAVVVLEYIVKIMDNRYKLLKDNKVKNIKEYNSISQNKLNYIAVIIDELGDLIIQDRKRIEPLLVRIAQLSRAAGIHLILATQRPCAEIVTGLIKDNMPSRMAFSLPTGYSSRIILDCKGAENLKGNGDGLIKMVGDNEPTRIQAPYIDTQELKEYIDQLKTL